MDGIILHILELAIIILHCETHYIKPLQNNDKHLVPRIQLYVLIFNVGKYNTGMNILVIHGPFQLQYVLYLHPYC
jgi:hypothetical protein